MPLLLGHLFYLDETLLYVLPPLSRCKIADNFSFTSILFVSLKVMTLILCICIKEVWKGGPN